jgi:dienelactone hydrolase
MRAPAFLALFALCVAPLAAQDAEAVDPRTDPRTRVLLLGDSISHGYHKTVVEELGEDFHVVRPMNANGKGYENCEGTTRGVKNLDRWLALDGGHWDVIHFNFGLHDLKHVLPGTMKNSNDPAHPNQAPIEVYERQLREITERLLATGAEVIFATTTPVPEGGVRPFRDPQDVIDYNWAASEVMFELEVHVNWLYSYAVTRMDEIQEPVNVHFTKIGSARLGAVVARKIGFMFKEVTRARSSLSRGWTWEHNRQLLVDAVLALEERASMMVLKVGVQDSDEVKVVINPAQSGYLVDHLEPAAAHQSSSKRSAPLVQKVRSLQRDGYRIEHLLIEARAGMRIPAHLYLPDSQEFSPPYAGVLIACGHAYEAKAHAPYQIAGAAFARHGMAALVFDPLDQGERIQAPKDDASRQQHWGTTSHNITGAQASLVGWSQAGLHAFDAMRCLDAMEVDPRIDPKRLGMCGQSGGGTQTAQLSAIDPRILASAPACYITSLPALARTIGPQDEEQNLFGQVRAGVDHADYLIARAPKPTLICAAEDDFFSIEGTYYTYKVAREAYTHFGAEENLQLVVSPGGHNWGRELVSATVAFMAKHLDGREIEVAWSDDIPMTLQEAQVTPRGHVVWMDSERTVYELMQSRAEEIREGQGHFSYRRHMRNWLGISREIAPAELLRGWEERLEGSRRNRAAMVCSNGLIALLASDLVDENEEQDPAVAWMVIGAGVSTAEAPAEAPGSVHFLDVICSGELTPTDRAWYGSFGPAGTDGAYGILLGRPLLARQVEQIIAYAKTMQGRPRLIASGLPALAAAHAFALAPELFAAEHSIELPFESWTDLFGYDAERDALAYVVPDAIRFYDLKDLLQVQK